MKREKIGGSINKQAFGKKRGLPTKETTKKTKKFVVEVGDSVDEEEKQWGRIKWKDFEVHHLIAICSEMDDKSIKTEYKPGELVLLFWQN